MQINGINEDNEFIFLSTLRKRFRSIEIIKLETFSKSEFKTKTKENKNILSSALPAEHTLIKFHFFKIKNSYLLKKALLFQSRLLTSLDPKDYVFNSLIQKKLKDGFPSYFFFVTKKNLSDHLKNFKTLDCDPDHVTTEIIALIRFFKSISPKIRCGFVIHIGMKKTLCFYMKNHLPHLFNIINIGINHFLDDLSNDILHFEKTDELIKKANSLDLLNLDTKIYMNLHKNLSLWKNQIHQAFFSFMQKEKQGSLPLLVTGQTSFFKNMKDFIFSSQFASKLLFPQPQKIEKYAISIGAALDQIANDHTTVQFRKDNFMSKKTMKKKIFSISFYFIFCTAVAFLTYFAGCKVIDNRKEQINNRILEIIQKDPSFKDKKIFQNYKDPENLLEKCERQLKIDMKPFPFIPNIFKISDIIAWLQSEETLKESNSEITNFSYELIDYPSIKESHLPYKAKITFEFLCHDPIKARQFHKKILARSNIIDLDQEIEWEVLLNDHYRTSFFLNNLSIEKIYDEKIY